MKCDRCDKPAVVHEVNVKHGVKHEIHLCEEHAREAGIIPSLGPEPINQMLTQFVVSQKTKKRKRAKSKKGCPECGLTFTRFRQKGLLGCPVCYEVFDAQLGGLIERTHNGGTHHAGKIPQRAGGSIDRQRMIQRLAKELDSAISAEQYERAAELRDQLQTLELEKPGNQDGP